MGQLELLLLAVLKGELRENTLRTSHSAKCLRATKKQLERNH